MSRIQEKFRSTSYPSLRHGGLFLRHSAGKMMLYTGNQAQESTLNLHY